MLAIGFLFSWAITLSWLCYLGLYLHGQLAGNDLGSLSPIQMAIYVGLALVPVWIVWQIFSNAILFIHTKKTNARLSQLLEQGKKNQDYTDLIVRVMIEAEHEIKDGFVINKFDVFVSGLNEILADIILRANISSTIQLEQLWTRVKNGERWIMGKTLVEAFKRQNTFADYLAQKAEKDAIFKGTLLEFCARYQDLSALLEKHDRDRVFISMIETGVFGSAYGLLAPIVDKSETQTKELPEETPSFENESLTSTLLNIPEPEKKEHVSFWKKMNPFNKENENSANITENNIETEQSDEDFFAALQQNLNSSSQSSDEEKPLPFLHAEQDNTPIPYLYQEETAPLPLEENYMPAPDIMVDSSITKSTNSKAQSDDFAYPFGGWLNEKNYK